MNCFKWWKDRSGVLSVCDGNIKAQGSVEAVLLRCDKQVDEEKEKEREGASYLEREKYRVRKIGKGQ